MNEKGIATLIRGSLPEFVGHASLYRIFPEVTYYADGVKHTTNYVIVSAVHYYFFRETYIFPADESGSVIDWGELDGSRKGTTSHQKALEDAGYNIVSRALFEVATSL
ncbi:MAG TPA: hypothetical protein PKD68_02910 [Candidatus Saccharibacteria bacterium]|nr:hypothetical protein [Candidatus Saccharibacteria bacterium]